jgi:hypothetical protein
MLGFDAVLIFGNKKAFSQSFFFKNTLKTFDLSNICNYSA